MQKTSPEDIEVKFQSLSFAEAQQILPAGREGKYSKLRIQIVERLDTLKVDETFIFKPTGIEKWTQGRINSLRTGVNTSLANTGHPWKVIYSPKASAFMVMPKERQKYSRRPRVNSEEQDVTLDLLFKTAQRELKMPLSVLQKKDFGNRDATHARYAIFYVGHKKLGLQLIDMAKVMGYSSAGATYCMQKAMANPDSREKVRMLSLALSRNGNGEHA